MAELDFKQVVSVLMQARKLVRSTRRMLMDVGVIIPHMGELERDLGSRAAEVEAYAQLIEDDANRPLIKG